MAGGDEARYRQFAGPIADESDLVKALRARVEECNVSRAEIDEELGLTGGYTSKRLTIPQIKYYGKEAFWNTAEMLGLAVVLVEDPHARARYAAKMKRRSKPQAIIGGSHWRSAHTQSIITEIARNHGKNGAKARNEKLSARRRKQIARHAAQIRWSMFRKMLKAPTGNEAP